MNEANYKIIYRIIVGSQSYGTAVQGVSDTDYKFVYMQTNDDLISFNYKEQTNINKDDTGYEIRRFLELLQTGNPTVLEMLYSPIDCIVYKDPVFDILLANRHKFLTKKCILSFGGYAIAQIQKARGLDKKMNWEKERVKRKTPIDFIYAYEAGKTMPITKWLEIHNKKQECCGLVALDHFKDCYALYYDKYNHNPDFYKYHNIEIIKVLNYRGLALDDSNSIRLSSIPKGEEALTIVYYNKDGYTMHCKDYKEYTEWLANRNTQRYTDNVGHDQKIDCYVEDETEFLTETGWKKYNEIIDDKVASVNIDGRLVFDNFIDRFQSNYSGDIYEYESRYTKFSITPNHNLLLHYLSRSNNNNFSTKIDVSDISNFKYIPVAEFINSKKNYSKILNLPLYHYNDVEYDLTDEEIKILGGYISDGSLTPSQIRIDQKENKPLYDFLNSYNKEEYFYFRFKNKKLYDFIIQHVGSGLFDKHLSTEFWKFSKRQFLILLDYMLKGQGTHHKKSGHDVYCTSFKMLADDLHTLCFFNGISTQIYSVSHKSGFEKSSSIKYHIFISREPKKLCYFNKKFNWNIKHYENTSICCFTTIHNNLVTKNNNKMAIQGNSKNLLHTRRLLDMAIEIASTGEITVRRPNAEYLLKIRRGEVSLDDIITQAEEDIKSLDILYTNSTLPANVSNEFVNELLLEMRHKVIKK